MSMNIPDKWGFCDGVFIVPIKVNDAYFTAVMDAPQEWRDALIVSGFRKTNEGWIKKGLANEHELRYLSESVTIENVDANYFDSYFNPVEEAPAELVVPDEVGQAIQWLAAQGRKALFFEFSLTHAELSDVMLSGYLEDAASGVSNSDTDIIYELAIERVKSIADGGLSESVIQFAKEKNISLVVQSDSVLTPQGSVLLSRGERVSWKGDDDVEHFGRVSRPLNVGDDGCWLFSLPVAWVGGYPSPSEIWVSAKALGFTVEPSAAEVVESDLGYEKAIDYLRLVNRSEVEDLANRVYKALDSRMEKNNSVEYSSWVANGKLWAEKSVVGTGSFGVGIVELDDLICPISEQDRAFIRELGEAIDAVSAREYGSDSIERTSLCFTGIPSREAGTPYFQYNINALFPVDAPQMRVTRTIAKSLGDMTDDDSVYASLSSYNDWFGRKTGDIRSYAPKFESENGVTELVVNAEFLDKSINSVVDKWTGFEQFKDRVIELGLENSLPVELVHRLLVASEDYAQRFLDNVTPVIANTAIGFPREEFYKTEENTRYTDGLDSGQKGFAIWRNLINKPVLARESISRIIRGDFNTGLPNDYYAVSGPAYGKGIDAVEKLVKDAGVGRLFDYAKTFKDGLVRTDCVFKSGVEHLQDEIPKFNKLLEELGCFDQRDYREHKSDGFSQEQADKWAALPERITDALRLSLVSRKILAYDRTALSVILDGEITRQWGAFFDKGNYPESTLNKVRLSVLNSVLSAASSFSNGGPDAVLFRMSKTRNHISWQSRSVDSESGEVGAPDWTVEPRGALLDYHYKAAYGKKRGGPKLVIDMLSIVDPELAGKLYGIGDTQEHAQKAKSSDEAGYQDTGVVTGYAIKDLRAMQIDSLLVATANMSSTQREKYIKKDLYFVRPTALELKEKGCSPQVAAFLDQAWVLLPSKPYSLMSNDIDFYGRLINGAKEGFSEILNGDYQIKNADADFFEAFDDVMKRATYELLDSQNWARRQFYRKGTVLKALYMMSALGLVEHAGKSKDNFDYIARVFESRFTVKKGGESLRMKDIDWVHLLPKKTKSDSKPAAKKVTNPDIRTGEDYRQGKVLLSEDFIKTFGFSGVEFGNWTNQAEREAHINLSYDSMLDFSKILECEPMALSLAGRLGLCFGSRGIGGKNPASAHYEPSNMAINLTRMSGAGSLAHEYFHAIAGHYGEVESGIKGSDYSTKSGNMLINSSVAQIAETPLMRKDMQEAFHNLMRAVIYQPDESGDINDISTYTKQTAMYKGSLALDEEGGGTRKYWSQPHELFARSMEVWVGKELEKKNARNDYLVSPSKLKLDRPVYPDAEHIKRISIYADKWVAALRTELKQVQHPYLGDVEMPVFHSKNRVRQPLNKHSLEAFALREMNVLFGKFQPEIAFSERSNVSAGTYDAVKNLMVLNLKHANRDTFYHESWHVCHSAMLSADDQASLLKTFRQDSVKALVIGAMKEHGYTSDSIVDAESNPLELQAYAFELWVGGKVALTEKRTESAFGDAKEVSDAAAEISNGFSLKGVEELFERFYGGELALENDLTVDLSSSQSDTAELYDDVSVVYAPAPTVKYRGMGM